jgi:hypothetical protein
MVPGDRDDRECPKRRTREGSSTVAEPAGGPPRSSGETPVMGEEQRGWLILEGFCEQPAGWPGGVQ